MKSMLSINKLYQASGASELLPYPHVRLPPAIDATMGSMVRHGAKQAQPEEIKQLMDELAELLSAPAGDGEQMTDG
jgi:predicted lipoprotein